MAEQDFYAFDVKLEATQRVEKTTPGKGLKLGSFS
jgi:hypothetical protein